MEGLELENRFQIVVVPEIGCCTLGPKSADIGSMSIQMTGNRALGVGAHYLVP